MLKTTSTQNYYKNQPQLDERYLKELREKDEIVKSRIEKRNQIQEKQRELTMAQVSKTIEVLTNHKKDMSKRNAIFQNDMRSHVERFHREIAKVYTADENLRDTKRVMDTFLRKFKPQVAAQLKNVLSNNSHSLEAKIFNVKNHAPIILNKNNELIRLEQTHKQLEEEIVKEELKQDIIQAKASGYSQFAKPHLNQPESQPENRELAATKKMNQPQQGGYQQSMKQQQHIDEEGLQKFDQDSDIDQEDNYATKKNEKSGGYTPQFDNRPMANPNQTQKGLQTQSQFGGQHDTKSNNETKRRQQNVFDEEVDNDFDEF